MSTADEIWTLEVEQDGWPPQRDLLALYRRLDADGARTLVEKAAAAGRVDIVACAACFFPDALDGVDVDRHEVASEIAIQPAELERGADGWELHVRDERPRMVSRQAFRLEREGDGPPLRVARRADGECPFCAGPLTFLLDLDRERLGAVGVDGERLRILTCERCTCYGHWLADVDLATGAATPSDAMTRPEYISDDEWIFLPETDLVVTAARRTPFESAALDVGHASLGGQPYWIQNVEHPTCPSCGEPMPFLAQLDLQDFDAEGSIYAFLDAACAVTATVFQQT